MSPLPCTVIPPLQGATAAIILGTERGRSQDGVITSTQYKQGKAQSHSHVNLRGLLEGSISRPLLGP